MGFEFHIIGHFKIITPKFSDSFRYERLQLA